MQLWMLPAFEPAVELGHFSKLLVGGRVENLSQYLFSFFSLFFFSAKQARICLIPQFPFPGLIRGSVTMESALVAHLRCSIHRSSCTGYQICAFQCWVQIAVEVPTLNQCTKKINK